MKCCSNCKHWKSYTNEQADYYATVGRAVGAKTCTAVGLFWTSTRWVEKDGDVILVMTEEAAGKTAFTQDSSDYCAYLLTLPSHYCSMHEDAAENETGAAI